MNTTHNMTQNGEEQVRRPHPGRLTFYHANAKGTGTALQVELRLNRDDEDRYDCFFLEMAQQKSAAAMRGGTRTPATFDWASKLTVKLGFSDICEFLAVLEGKRQDVGAQHNGIYHEADGSNTLIAFKQRTESAGFLLGVSKKDKQGTQVFKGHIVLSEIEGIGLRCVFQTGLFYMVFHRNIR